MIQRQKGEIVIPAGVNPWPHELRVANILALAGHNVRFLPASPTKTADILLDGVEFEIKSPRTDKANSLEHVIRRALRQSSNLIIDSSRTDGKRFPDSRMCNFLVATMRRRKQIKRMLFITRGGRVIDISVLL